MTQACEAGGRNLSARIPEDSFTEFLFSVVMKKIIKLSPTGLS
jgi:hypothetical protein